MPRAITTLSWSAALETYVCSEPQVGEARAPAPEGPAWVAWLAGRSSFAFHGQTGSSFTARLEAVQRGERYWYAYLRTGQQLRKKYLGKTAELTLARLEQMARLLQAERASGVPLDTPVSTRQGQPRPPPTPETITTTAQRTAAGRAALVEEPPVAQSALLADPLTPLLSTRLHVPRAPARLVPRARLIERLSQGLSQSLILVCAPAGFGKTTLLAQFLAECHLPAAWLSLDEEDNDPLRFLAAVLSALQTCDPSLGASVHALLSSGQSLSGLSLPAVFARLLGELAERSRDDELLLVLDDYHVLSSEPIAHAMAWLVEHCPPQLHLLIATRSDPVLKLSRLRARGLLCELRAADLQFAAEEARQLLQAALARDLPDATLTTLLSQTEGWVAGLQLLALALQGRESPAEVQQVLTDAGSHRYLVDYLVAEVLAREEEAVQSFLLHTSILSPLSAALCAAVTGTSEQESAARLAELERANLFLFPTDAGAQWYRYHQLWAAVLRARLSRQLGAEGVAALYGRASRWYEQHDMPSEALEAALAAGEFAHTTDLVEQLSPRLIARAQYDTLRRWIERLPHAWWAARPLVCLAYAWTLSVSGARQASLAPLEEAEQLFRRQENSVGVGQVEALRAIGALLWADGQEALRAGQRALALLPAGERLLRSTCLSVVGGGSWLLGEVETAWRRLVEAHAQPEQTLETHLLNSMLLGHVLLAQGQLHEAAASYQQVIDRAADHRDYAIHGRLRLAGLLYEWNALAEAEAQLAEVLAEAPAVLASLQLGRGELSLAYALQARIKEARGEQEAASALFTQALAVAQRQRHPQFLAQAQAAQVRFWLAHGQVEAARRWREAWGRPADAAPRYVEEPSVLTLARVLIAEGESEQALRLLDGFHDRARAQGRLDSEVEILVLSALAEDAQGQASQAVQDLEQALVLAEPAGYVRLFVDEGVPMLTLLRQVHARREGRRGADYVGRLLGILEAEHRAAAEQLPRVPFRQHELDAHPAPPPVRPTRLIGREQEMAEVCRQLRRPEVRLLTLTGPGGVGKTHLALSAAQELVPDFADGVWFVPLSAISDPAFVLPAIAQALGQRQTGARSLLEEMQAALADHSLLLLLDNFEHVLPAAPLLAELLSACPHVSTLVTSRAALRLSGEHELAVLPLALPDLAQLSPPESLMQYAACALFIERTRAIQPGFAASEATAPAIAEICLRLDGLPLAIELAAARSRLLSPQALLARLGQPLSVLTGGTRNAPERQQTMRATIAWSYQLLAPEEQRLFRWLAVFAGSCTIEAVEALAEPAGLAAHSVLDRVSALVEHSLLRKLEQPASEPRLVLLETIREYGLECLERSGEWEAARTAHAAYYLRMAEEAAPQLRGTEQGRWVAQLEREQENLRAALGSLLEQAHAQAGTPPGARAVERALRLCVALSGFWDVRGDGREGVSYLMQALAESAGVGAALRARALVATAELALFFARHLPIERLVEESLALYEELGDPVGTATGLYLLGYIARIRSQFAQAQAHLEEAAARFQALGDRWRQGRCYTEWARVATEQGQYEQAQARLAESLLLYQELGDPQRLGWVRFLQARLVFVQHKDQALARHLAEQSLAHLRQLGSPATRAYPLALLGLIHLEQDELEAARPLLEESLALTRQSGAVTEVALGPALGLARLSARQGDAAEARRLYRESLTLLVECNVYQEGIAAYLEGLAALSAGEGKPRQAVWLWGAAHALREAIGAPMYPAYRATYEQALAQARAQLGEQAFHAAWAQEQLMTPAQALAALEKAMTPTAVPTGAAAAAHAPARPSPFGLTARELDVLRLLSRGLSDAQIAEQLVIARRTVNWYLTSIYSKLGVSSRAAATRAALEQHLV